MRYCTFCRPFISCEINLVFYVSVAVFRFLIAMIILAPSRFAYGGFYFSSTNSNDFRLCNIVVSNCTASRLC